MEGNVFGGPERFASLARIVFSPFQSPPLDCALGWTEFINPREEAVLPMEATCSLVNVYPAAASERQQEKEQVQTASTPLESALLLREQSRAW